MISALIGMVAGPLVDKLIAPFTALFTAHINKQISFEELRAQMINTLVSSTADVEKTHAQELSKTYESFQVTMRQSPMVQRVWAVIVLSQLLVLLWHQAGIPAFVYVTGQSYPSSGSTVEWSYALIGFMFGAGALLLRTGPGAATGMDKLKSLVQKK
jgi:hypothetical protein